MTLEAEMQAIIRSLGIDLDTFEWQELAFCRNIDPAFITAENDIFYDKYEKDSKAAIQTDQMCLHCPVAAECFDYGQYNMLTGVFGGFYLIKGQVDKSKNKHKTPEIVKLLAEKLI